MFLEILKSKPKPNILARTKQHFAEKWKDIAFELIDDYRAFTCIDDTSKSDESKCMDMLVLWLEKHKDSSYQKLFDALKHHKMLTAIEKIKEQVCSYLAS